MSEIEKLIDIDSFEKNIEKICNIEWFTASDFVLKYDTDKKYANFIYLQKWENGNLVGGSLDNKIDHLEKFIINEGDYELPEYILDDIDKIE